MANRERWAISAKRAGKQLISDNLGQGQHGPYAIALTHRVLNLLLPVAFDCA